MVYQLTCPKCGSHNIATICYGHMEMTPELFKRVAEGKIVLGGCAMAFEGDDYHCNTCKHRWRDPQGPGE